MMTLATLVFIVSCAGDTSKGVGPATSGFRDPEFIPDQEQAKEHLKDLIREKITNENQVSESSGIPVIYRRPYYFREYSVYPDGAEGFTIEFRENDLRTRPLIAEVKLNKTRYSTKMHRKQNLAASDTDFLRDTGSQTLVFEWHNGRWVQTGAIFDAEKTDEKVNGEWVAHEEEPVRVDPAAEQRGWFGRIWERVRGEK